MRKSSGYIITEKVIYNKLIESGKKVLREEKTDNGITRDGECRKRPEDYYVIGDVLEFNNKNLDNMKYLESGFSVPEDWGIWTVGTQAVLSISVRNQMDKVLYINCSAFNARQNVIVEVNDMIIGNFQAVGDDGIYQIPIPGGDGAQRLRIVLQLPDACSPASLGVGDDSREIALGLKKICIFENNMVFAKIKKQIELLGRIYQNADMTNTNDDMTKREQFSNRQIIEMMQSLYINQNTREMCHGFDEMENYMVDILDNLRYIKEKIQ